MTNNASETNDSSYEPDCNGELATNDPEYLEILMGAPPMVESPPPPDGPTTPPSSGSNTPPKK